MPSALRSRLALLLMLGAFLIPIASSNLRGIGHVLTCEQETKSPFTLLIEEGQEPTILTSQRFSAEESTTLCETEGSGGGLELNVRARARGNDRVEMVLPIRNTSQYDWEGSVRLVIAGTSVPVRVGEIAAGATEEATVVLPNLGEGQTIVDGSLLIGP